MLRRACENAHSVKPRGRAMGVIAARRRGLYRATPARSGDAARRRRPESATSPRTSGARRWCLALAATRIDVPRSLIVIRRLDLELAYSPSPRRRPGEDADQRTD